MNSRFKVQILGALLLLLLIGQTVFAADGGGWNNWEGQIWGDGVEGGIDSGEWTDEEWDGGAVYDAHFNGRFPPMRYWQCTAVNRRNIPFVGQGRTRWEAEQNSLRDCYWHRSRFCGIAGCRVI